MDQKYKNYLILLLGLTVLLIVGFLGYFLWQNRTKISSLPSIVSPSSSPSNIQPVVSLTPKYIGNYDVVVKINSQSPCNNTNIYLDKCLSDIYLKDKNTGREIFILTVDDIPSNDSRVPVYKNGYIFLIRRTGNDKYPSNDWTDELWVYTDNNQGKKLYSDQGLEFSVRPDGLSVVIIVPNKISPSSVQTISVLTGERSSVYQVDLEKCVPDPEQRKMLGDITLLDWNNAGNELWGDAEGEYGVVGCFWNLNLNTGQFTYYPVPSNTEPLGELNTEKLVAVYIDKPPMVDEDTYNIWLAGHPTYSLYLYDLQTQQSTKIGTIPSAGGFQMIGWDRSTVFHYQISGKEFTYSLK